MADINEFPSVPGYVSIKQAADMLGITDKRVYRYIDLGRLPAYKSGGVFLLAEEDVRQFKLYPPGRTRTEPPRWRVYNPRSKVLITEIQQANRHPFPGTIARYIIKGNPELTSVHLILAWKDTEMPGESAREQHLKALQEELSDVLMWEQSQSSTNEAIIHT